MIGLKKSPWLIHYDASSCNGCDIEVLACLTPMYDVERLGVVNTGNPKHADIFLITGAVNEQSKSVIQNIYRQLPEPKVVVAIGICASTGGIFRDCYNVSGGVDTVVPVDLYVPGCAARPEAIMDGVVKAVEILQEKHREMASMANSIDQTIICKAEGDDLPEILALQKVAYQSEAEIYGDDSLPALQQSLEEIRKDFERGIFLKAVVNGKIIGTIRGYREGDTAHLLRCSVHPYFRGRGIAARLANDLERAFPDVKRFEIFTGDRSKRNLYIYGKMGYKIYKSEPSYTPSFRWVYLEKMKP